MCQVIITGELIFNQPLTAEVLDKYFGCDATDFDPTDPLYSKYTGRHGWDYDQKTCRWRLKNRDALILKDDKKLKHAISWLKCIIRKVAEHKLNGHINFDITYDTLLLKNVAFIQVTDNIITWANVKKFKATNIVIDHLRADVELLKQQNRQLQLELDYQPGGKGALAAQEHFESMASNQN